MPLNVTGKLIKGHLLFGDMILGTEFGQRNDQTLTQDATSTMVMLKLEEMGLERAKNRSIRHLSVQHVLGCFFSQFLIALEILVFGVVQVVSYE